MTEQNNNNQLLRFSYPIPLDADQFMRRECPHCGLHFKIVAPSSAMVDSLVAPFEAMGEDYSDSETYMDEPSALCCPYCSYCGSVQQFIPQLIHHTIRQWIIREVLQPAVNNWTADIECDFNRPSLHSKNSSINLTFHAERIIRTAQPFVHPELPDMNLVILLCCRQRIKIKEGWLGIIACPYCMEELRLQ